MTFLTELARLKAAAGNTQAYSSNHYSRDSLKSFLFNRADAIEALAVAAQDLESWLGKVVGGENAEVEITATDIGAEGTAQRLQSLQDALAALDAAGKGEA